MDYTKAISTLTAWAQNNDNVRAIVMTGSAAAQEAHPLSDRDIEVYATDPTPLLADDSWWDHLGDVLVVERLANPGWHPTRLVYYVGGKLDLTIIRAEALPTMRYERPFVVLVDKDSLSVSLPQAAVRASRPDEAAFQEQLNWGYAAALMCAKAVVRDEPWSSKIRDRDLKAVLLTFIEWDHQARYGPDHDVRFLGSRMRHWMDADVQQALEQCWGRFDAVDSAGALRTSIVHSRSLARASRTSLASSPSTTTAFTAKSKPFSRCIRMSARGIGLRTLSFAVNDGFRQLAPDGVRHLRSDRPAATSVLLAARRFSSTCQDSAPAGNKASVMGR